MEEVWAYVLLMLLGIAWIIIVDITFIARFLHASKAKKVITFVKITEDDKLIYVLEATKGLYCVVSFM